MKHFTTRFVRRILPAGFLSVGLYGFATTLTTPVSSPKVDYATDIQPIFNAHCLPCHSATSKMGGLVLESGKALMQSKIAIPNRSSESRLMDRLLGKKGLPRMPMGFGSLRESDIALIKSWIDQGCVVTENTSNEKSTSRLPQKQTRQRSCAELPSTSSGCPQLLRKSMRS